LSHILALGRGLNRISLSIAARPFHAGGAHLGGQNECGRLI
jgi:hypothetical protein